MVLATFGPAGALSRTPVRCRRHRLPSDVDTRHAGCGAADCRRRAYYGLAGGPARWCLQHKQESCVDVTSKRCEAWVDSQAPPSFVSSTASQPRSHAPANTLSLPPKEAGGAEAPGGKPDGAENRAGQDGGPPVEVVGNKQRAGYCPSQANFGDASDRRKRFCARHRRLTDVDLRKVPRLAARPRRGDGLVAVRVTAVNLTAPLSGQPVTPAPLGSLGGKAASKVVAGAACADASPGADGS